MSRTVTITAWHPYPTFFWEYKPTGAEEWADITGYARYEDGQGEKDLLIADEVIEGDQCAIRCIVSNPDGSESVTSDEVYVTVGALAWDDDLPVGGTKVIIVTIPTQDP